MPLDRIFVVGNLFPFVENGEIILVKSEVFIIF